MGTIIIVGSSILWGIMHSILASHGFKQFVKKYSGEQAFNRFYRLAYNSFAFASLFPIFMMLLTFPDKPLYSVPSPWDLVMVFGQGLALIGLIAGVVQTGVMRFAGISQLTASAEDDVPAPLVVDGLYSYVRHPLYTAGLVFIWLSPEMTLNRLAFWLVLSAYFVIGAYFEEKKLLREFGAQYADYRARTPMFIPLRAKKTN